MLGGYAGKILRVDLSSGRMRRETISEEWLRKFLGGEGLATRILYSELEAGVNPLSPKNKLIFMTGPLTGTITPAAPRYSVAARSPLTLCIGTSNAGGFFGPELKFAGWDGIIVEGRAEKPVYLLIRDGEVELKDASHLWGKDTYETEEILRREVGGKNLRCACIGPAGENLVLIASILNDKCRLAGRTGMGAVMGSKRLKAIAVEASRRRIEVADEEELKRLSGEIVEKLQANPLVKLLSDHGTDGFFKLLMEEGYGLAKNWTQAGFAVEKLDGENITRNLMVRRTSCFMCPIACHRDVRIDSGPYAGYEGPGPEYETVGAIGCLCLIDDLKAITKASDLCNRYGIDTISTGSIIAFAMECYEKGLITKEDTGGVELAWGNVDAVLEMIRMIAFREGFGNLLAEGSRRAAEKIGGEAPQLAMQVKGLELAMHDPRVKPGYGLSFATNTTGGRHTEGVEGSENPSTIILDQNMHAVVNSTGLCRFAYVALSHEISDAVLFSYVPKLLSAAVGWDITLEEVLKTGERIFNLKRLFNLKHGIGKEEDRLPRRFLEEPLQTGPAKGRICNLKPLLEKYYELRGWNAETGYPTREKLEELELSDLLEDES